MVKHTKIFPGLITPYIKLGTSVLLVDFDKNHELDTAFDAEELTPELVDNVIIKLLDKYAEELKEKFADLVDDNSDAYEKEHDKLMDEFESVMKYTNKWLDIVGAEEVEKYAD